MKTHDEHSGSALEYATDIVNDFQKFTINTLNKYDHIKNLYNNLDPLLKFFFDGISKKVGTTIIFLFLKNLDAYSIFKGDAMDLLGPKNILDHSDEKLPELEINLSEEVQNCFLIKEIMQNLAFLEDESYEKKLASIQQHHDQIFNENKKKEITERNQIRNELILNKLSFRMKLEKMNEAKLNFYT